MTDEINEILRLKSALAQDGELPSGCAFLSDDILLAYPQADGDARYPYACDGLTLWTHSSGNIIMNESKFNIFPDTTRGKEPAVAFFVGEKSGNVFRPISVTGVASGVDLDVERFTVFTKKTVTYQTVTDKNVFELCGEAFGNFQNALKDFDASALVETIPHFHDTPNDTAFLFEP